MSGKGHAPRPYSVPKETFDQSFERIFGRKPIKTQEQLNEWLNVALKEKADEGKSSDKGTS